MKVNGQVLWARGYGQVMGKRTRKPKSCWETEPSCLPLTVKRAPIGLHGAAPRDPYAREGDLPAARGLPDTWGRDILAARFSTGDSSELSNFSRPSELGAARCASPAAGRRAASPRPGPSLRVLGSATGSLRAAGGASGCGGDQPNCTEALRDRASAEETEPISEGRAGPSGAAKAPGGTHTPRLPKVYSLLARERPQPVLLL